MGILHRLANPNPNLNLTLTLALTLAPTRNPNPHRSPLTSHLSPSPGWQTTRPTWTTLTWSSCSGGTGCSPPPTAPTASASSSCRRPACSRHRATHSYSQPATATVLHPSHTRTHPHTHPHMPSHTLTHPYTPSHTLSHTLTGAQPAVRHVPVHARAAAVGLRHAQGSPQAAGVTDAPAAGEREYRIEPNRC